MEETPMATTLQETGPEVSDLLRQTLADTLERVSKPGTWWSGEERVAIARESRNASACPYCNRCKEALSPFSEEGEHAHLSLLSDPAVDLIHRLTTDPGRLTLAWFEGIIEQGLSEGAYVEIVGMVSSLVCVDTFHLGLGLPAPELAPPEAGEASRETPDGAARTMAWVPTVSPRTVTGKLADAWFPEGDRDRYVPRVQCALSLVPDEAIVFKALGEAMYMSAEAVGDFTCGRDLSRPQIELIAARVSALNRCFY